MTEEILFENVTLTKMVCGTCGVCFAMPLMMQETKMREKGTFFCPNGHERGWFESDADRLRKQLEEKQRELTAQKCETLRERQARELAEKKLTSVTTKIAKGVCPCCKRSFANLRRHMETKHSSQVVLAEGPK
jgi:hypothetical protein